MYAYLNLDKLILQALKKRCLYGHNKLYTMVNEYAHNNGFGQNPPFHPLTVDGEFYVPPRRLAFEIKSLPIVLTVPNMMV